MERRPVRPPGDDARREVVASAPQMGSRKVEPRTGRRHRKDTPSRRARRARRLAQRLDQAAVERMQLRADGRRVDAAVLTEELDDLHASKRSARRGVYRLAPDLEGQPVRPGNQTGGSR